MVVYTLEQCWEVGLRLTYRRCRFWQKKKKIIFSDEAHFDLGGYVNKQFCRIWGTENQDEYIEKLTQAKGKIDLQKIPILTKTKIIISVEAHFDLGGYVN